MKWEIINKQKLPSDVSPEDILKILLKNRSLTAEKEIKEFLNPPTPFSLDAETLRISGKEIDKAIRRIKKAIAKKEKIIVYGDYDTDGICGTAIIWEIMRDIGANAMPFIPKREEGYGMQIGRLEEMAKEGVGLVITVDNGIVAFDKALVAKKFGLDLIITDHHLPEGEKPESLAVIHTTRLSGAGVAWFLAKELSGSLMAGLRSSGNVLESCDDWLGLAAVGTITDIMPLIGPNRSIVKYGLRRLIETKRPGLRWLFRLAGLERKEIGNYEVSYIIGPRLNAAGRLDDPMDSLRLLCTRNEQRAQWLAGEIDRKNRERQELLEISANRAKEIWLKEGKENKLIFVSHKEFHEGIIGLIAGKLTEEFYRPAVVVAEGLEPARGSARSIVGFNIVEAIRECADVLGDHGGHALAAGFSVEVAKISLFKEKLERIAQEKLRGTELTPLLRLDLELPLKYLNLDLFRTIEKMAPFGEGNPQPVFCACGVKITNASVVGRDRKHLSLWLTENNPPRQGGPIRAIGFNMGYLFPQLTPDSEVDIAYNLASDKWEGEERLRIKIKDIKVLASKVAD